LRERLQEIADNSIITDFGFHALDDEGTPEDEWIEYALPINVFRRIYPESEAELSSAISTALTLARTDYIRHEPYLVPVRSKQSHLSFGLFVKYENNGLTVKVIPRGFNVVSPETLRMTSRYQTKMLNYHFHNP